MSEAYAYNQADQDRRLLQAAERRPSRVAGVDIYVQAWQYILGARGAQTEDPQLADTYEEIAREKLAEFIDIEERDEHPYAFTESLRAYTTGLFLPLLTKLPANGEAPTQQLKRELNRKYADGLYGDLGEVAQVALNELDANLAMQDPRQYDFTKRGALIGYLMELTPLMVFARHQSVAYMAFPADPGSDAVLGEYAHDIFLCDLRSKKRTAYAPFQVKFSEGPNEDYLVPVINAHDVGNDINAHGDGKIFGTVRVMLKELGGSRISKHDSRYLTDLSTYLSGRHATYLS